MITLPLTTLQEIPPGKSGALDTLKIMRQLVRAGKKNIRVRYLALSLVNGLRQKDYYAEARLLHEFVRDKVRYVRDIKDIETLHDVDRILDNMQGDCDDKAILLASLLESIGHPTRFVALASYPEMYCHVLVETRIGQSWIPAEATEYVKLGWYPQGVFSRLVVNN